MMLAFRCNPGGPSASVDDEMLPPVGVVSSALMPTAWPYQCHPQERTIVTWGDRAGGGAGISGQAVEDMCQIGAFAAANDAEHCFRDVSTAEVGSHLALDIDQRADGTSQVWLYSAARLDSGTLSSATPLWNQVGSTLVFPYHFGYVGLGGSGDQLFVRTRKTTQLDQTPFSAVTTCDLIADRSGDTTVLDRSAPARAECPKYDVPVPMPPVPGDSDTNPFFLPLTGGSLSGSTALMTDPAVVSCGGYGGVAEAVYFLQLSAPTRVRLDTAGSRAAMLTKSGGPSVSTIARRRFPCLRRENGSTHGSNTGPQPISPRALPAGHRPRGTGAWRSGSRCSAGRGARPTWGGPRSVTP